MVPQPVNVRTRQVDAILKLTLMGRSPSNSLGFFALGLRRQGPAGRPKAAPPAVRKAASALEVRPEQSSILRGGTESFWPANCSVNGPLNVSFILARRLVIQSAVQ